MCALPAGARRARDQVDALAAYEQHPGRATLRSDRDARYRAIWQAIVHRADWRTMTVCGTWEALADQVGVSRSTVARALRWYRAAGLLGVVHTGASAGALGGTVNRAPTYVLAVPEQPEPEVSAGHSPTVGIDTPPAGGLSVGNQITRASAASPSAPLRGLENSAPTNRGAILVEHPGTRRARLAACRAMIVHDLGLRRLSPHLLRHLLRPWFDAGWSPSDVLHALNHRPSGEQWRMTTDVRTPAAWVRHRLAQWRDQGGAVLPSRSQQARAQAEQASRPRVAPPEWVEALAAREVPTEVLAQRSRRGGALVRAALAAAHTRSGGPE